MLLRRNVFGILIVIKYYYAIKYVELSFPCHEGTMENTTCQGGYIGSDKRLNKESSQRKKESPKRKRKYIIRKEGHN